MTKNLKFQENRLSNLQYTFKHFLNVTGSDGLTTFIFISDFTVLFFNFLHNGHNLSELNDFFWGVGVMERAACCRPRKRQLLTSTIEKCRMVDVDQYNLFCRCWLSTVDVDHTALFLVDVNQTAHFQLVDGRRSSTSILQPFSSRPGFFCFASNFKLIFEF